MHKITTTLMLLFCCSSVASFATEEFVETPWEYFDCKGKAVEYSFETNRRAQPAPVLQHRLDCEFCEVNAHVPVETYVPLRAYVGQTVGRGIGYNHGYTSLGLLYTPARPGCCVFPFLDLRGHVFTKGKFAYNLGGGLRFLLPRLGRVFGINAYYDYRRHKRDYHQLGVGFELLGPCYDFRINGYFPVGCHTHESHKRTYCYPGGFKAVCRQKQHSLRGFDGEIGTSLRKLCPCSCRCWDIYAAVGAYSYSTEHCRHNATGPRLRLGVSFCDNLFLEFRLTDDRYYGTRAQGFFAFSVPLYICEEVICDDCCNCNICLRSLADVPVVRQEIIATGRERCSWKTNY